MEVPQSRALDAEEKGTWPRIVPHQLERRLQRARQMDFNVAHSVVDSVASAEAVGTSADAEVVDKDISVVVTSAGKEIEDGIPERVEAIEAKAHPAKQHRSGKKRMMGIIKTRGPCSSSSSRETVKEDGGRPQLPFSDGNK